MRNDTRIFRGMFDKIEELKPHVASFEIGLSNGRSFLATHVRVDRGLAILSSDASETIVDLGEIVSVTLNYTLAERRRRMEALKTIAQETMS